MVANERVPSICYGCFDLVVGAVTVAYGYENMEKHHDFDQKQ